jgi:DNA (cytosine-5)-methyltransferase 1
VFGAPSRSISFGNFKEPFVTPKNPSNKPKNQQRPIAVDLFSGAGGLSLGLEQAGFDVVTSVEYDPVHSATHEFNFPLTETLCADVSMLSPEDLLSAVRRGAKRHGRHSAESIKEIDLIAGGPPCQGFSLIGKRLIDDTRNELVFHFFRLVSALKPRYFIVENVPGMATGGHTSILEHLISEFEGAGYRFPDENKYRILNAADYGVPQARRRLFLIGSREDQVVASVPPPTTIPVAPAGANNMGSDLPFGPSVWDAIGDIPNLDSMPELFESDEVTLSDDVRDRAQAAASKYARKLNLVDRDLQNFSYRRHWDPRLLTSSIRTRHTQKSIDRFEATTPGETEPTSRFLRLDPEGLCNTLRAGSGSERGAFTSPRPIHPKLPRVISNREAARLHSFPDWFRLHRTKWHGFRQIGNAVAPLVGRAVGAEIVKALGVKPSAPKRKLKLGDQRLLGFTMTEAAFHFGASKDQIPAQRTRAEGVTASSTVKVLSRPPKSPQKKSRLATVNS